MLALVSRSATRPSIVKMVLSGGLQTTTTTLSSPNMSPIANTLTSTICSWHQPVDVSFDRQGIRSFGCHHNEFQRPDQSFFNNDYHQLIDRAGAKRRNALANPLRFQSISDRADRSDIPASFIDNELMGK